MDDPAPCIWYLIALVLILLLQILAQLGRTAAVICKDTKLQERAQDGDSRAVRLSRLLEHSRRFLSAVRGYQILLSALAIFFFYYEASPMIDAALPSSMVGWTLWTKAAAVLGFVFFFSLLGESIPKTVAGQHPNMAYPLSGYLVFVCGLMRPLCAVHNGFAFLLVRLFGVDPRKNAEQVTEENILMLVDAGQETGVIEESQKEMITNIFEFDDICAGDVMCHRTDIYGIEASEDLAQVISIAIQEGYSRYPVYEEDLDEIIGVLYVKDLLSFVGAPLPKECTVRQLMREAYYVPESKRCEDLFKEMTEKRIQLAIVVDEYGGTAGLVTLEDLVESIVGNIQDEYDDEAEEIRQINETTFDMDGTTDLSEVSEILGADLPEGDYDTLGGMMMSLLGRVPGDGEHPIVSAAGYRFQALQIEDHRIERIHVDRDPEAVSANE